MLLIRSHGGSGVDPRKIRAQSKGTPRTGCRSVAVQFEICLLNWIMQFFQQSVHSAMFLASTNCVQQLLMKQMFISLLTFQHHRVPAFCWKAANSRSFYAVLLPQKERTGAEAFCDPTPQMMEPLKTDVISCWDLFFFRLLIIIIIISEFGSLEIR